MTHRRTSTAAESAPALILALALFAAIAFASKATALPAGVGGATGAGAADTTRKLGMVDTVTVLPAMHVDADRSLTPDRTSATSVRIERTNLIRFQPSTTADALLAAPGVDVSRTGPWASRVALRGMSGERVLVLVDGVRLQSGRGHGAQTSLVSVDRLESVEILPGSGGAQFGSDALAGVVELTTHRNLLGEAGSTLMLSVRSGGPGNERSGLTRLRFMGPRVSAELSGGLGGLDALVTPDGRVANSSYHEDDYAARLQARLGVSTLDFERTRHAARDIELPAFSDNSGSHAEYPLQSRGTTRLEWTLPGTKLRPDLRVLASQQHFRTAFVETVADSQFLRGRYVATRTSRADDRIDTWANSVQPSLRRGGSRFYGEYRRELTSGPRTTELTVVNAAGVQTAPTARASGQSIPPARREVLAVGAFTSAAWNKLKLEWGARYDWVHAHADDSPNNFTTTLEVTDQRPSFEAGLSRPIGIVTPYARAASGFRVPNLEERYFNDDIHGGMRLFGNPDLRAERTQTIELGVRTRGVAVLRLSSARVSAYRSEVADLITLVYLGQLYRVPRFQYTNVKRAQLDGIELQLEHERGPLRVSANAAFPRGLDLGTGRRITDIGAARATVDVRLPMTRLLPYGALSLRGRWTDASGTDDETLARPAFWTSSLELSCVTWNTRLTVAVKNLTNTRYREPLSFIPEPGRSVLLSMRRELALPWHP